MSTNSEIDGKDPRWTAQAAEIAAHEEDWETLDRAAMQLLGLARMGKHGEFDTEDDA